MSTFQSARRREKYRQLSGVLLDDVRRRIVHELHEADGTIPVAELADRLRETASGPESSSPAPVETLRVELRHRHLPKLVENGLVHWNREDGTVTSGYHPVYNDHSPGDLVPTNATGSLAAVLDSPRRRAALASFEAENEQRAREEVARDVASSESVGAPPESLVGEVRSELHHQHLPKLDDAGYVDYDAEDGTVAYRGAEELRTVLRQRNATATRPRGPETPSHP